MPDDRSELIRQAFADSIGVLGEQGGRALLEDLQRRGVHLNDITLEELMLGLKDALGDESAELIMQQVIIRLDEMYSLRR